MFLCLVQPRKLHGRECAFLWFHLSRKDVTQFGHAIVFGIDGIVECVKHRFVGGLVEVELHAQIVCILEVDERLRRGNGDHHTVAIYIGDGGGEGEIGEPFWGERLKELNGLAIFKEVLNVFVRLVVVFLGDFHHQLIQRVIVTATGIDRIPADAPMNLALDVHLLRLHTEFFLLRVVFHLKKTAETL